MPRCAGAGHAVPEHGKPVVPEGALQHIRETRSQGYAHSTKPEQRHLGPHFIHDLPLPVRFDARPYRCSQCKNQYRYKTTGDIGGTHDSVLPFDSEDEDLPLAEYCKRKVTPQMPDEEGSEDELPLAAFCPRPSKKDWSLKGQEIDRVASQSYWTVSDDDIRREFPGAICSRKIKKSPVWMTPFFLFEVCMSFHECLNARELRRRLASLYSSHALAEQVRAEREGVAPYSFAWAVASIPDNSILREIVLKGFTGFIDARVRVMRRRQLAYNSQGIRCDGNYKLAKILKRALRRKRTSTVVVAFCGTDGSLLDVPAPLPTEGFDHIQSVLEPLLVEIQEVRLACGYSLLESQPVFHATDVYHIHDACLRRLYAKVWSGLRVATHGATPKGGVRRRTVLPPECMVDTCIPTG